MEFCKEFKPEIEAQNALEGLPKCARGVHACMHAKKAKGCGGGGGWTGGRKRPAYA